VVEVDSWVYYSFEQRLDTHYHFHGARRSEQMPDRGFRGIAGYLVCPLPEYLLNSHGLGDIAQIGGRAVRVDIVNIFRLEIGRIQSDPHRPASTEPFRMRGRHVVGIGGHAAAKKLGEEFGTTSLRMLFGLENDDSRTFAHKKTIPFLVERFSGSSLRVVMARA